MTKARPRLRLDELLVEQGLLPTRHKAQREIQSGHVFIDGQRVDKPGTLVSTGARIDLKQKNPYVSQGGIKLAHAFRVFRIDVERKTCADIGASTGGFTDCLLQHGAGKVYAVDVGKGQLDWNLRNDPRVIVHEGVNARHLSRDHIPELLDLAAVDVSFISLRLILPSLVPLLSAEGDILALVKPQFEAGRGLVARGGVVRDPAVHEQILHTLSAFASDRLHLTVAGATHSPLRGPAGNIEFFLWLVPSAEPRPMPDLGSVVREAHAALTSR